MTIARDLPTSPRPHQSSPYDSFTEATVAEVVDVEGNNVGFKRVFLSPT